MNFQIDHTKADAILKELRTAPRSCDDTSTSTRTCVTFTLPKNDIEISSVALQKMFPFSSIRTDRESGTVSVLFVRTDGMRNSKDALKEVDDTFTAINNGYALAALLAGGRDRAVNDCSMAYMDNHHDEFHAPDYHGKVDKACRGAVTGK